MALIAFQTGKDHLRVTDDDHDAEIQSKLTMAEGIIVDYLKAQADPSWDETTTPVPVQAAVLIMLGFLYEHRGEDLEAGAGDFDEGAWNAVGRLLMRLRDPALA